MDNTEDQMIDDQSKNESKNESKNQSNGLSNGVTNSISNGRQMTSNHSNHSNDPINQPMNQLVRLDYLPVHLFSTRARPLSHSINHSISGIVSVLTPGCLSFFSLTDRLTTNQFSDSLSPFSPYHPLNLYIPTSAQSKNPSNNEFLNQLTNHPLRIRCYDVDPSITYKQSHFFSTGKWSQSINELHVPIDQTINQSINQPNLLCLFGCITTEHCYILNVGNMPQRSVSETINQTTNPDLMDYVICDMSQYVNSHFSNRSFDHSISQSFGKSAVSRLINQSMDQSNNDAASAIAAIMQAANQATNQPIKQTRSAVKHEAGQSINQLSIQEDHSSIVDLIQFRLSTAIISVAFSGSCQSVSQSMSHSVDLAMEPSGEPIIDPSTHATFYQPVDQSVDQSIDLSMNESVDQSLNESVHQTINTSINPNSRDMLIALGSKGGSITIWCLTISQPLAQSHHLSIPPVTAIPALVCTITIPRLSDSSSNQSNDETEQSSEQSISQSVNDVWITELSFAPDSTRDSWMLAAGDSLGRVSIYRSTNHLSHPPVDQSITQSDDQPSDHKFEIFELIECTGSRSSVSSLIWHARSVVDHDAWSMRKIQPINQSSNQSTEQSNNQSEQVDCGCSYHFHLAVARGGTATVHTFHYSINQYQSIELNLFNSQPTSRLHGRHISSLSFVRDLSSNQSSNQTIGGTERAFLFSSSADDSIYKWSISRTGNIELVNQSHKQPIIQAIKHSTNQSNNQTINRLPYQPIGPTYLTGRNGLCISADSLIAFNQTITTLDTQLIRRREPLFLVECFANSIVDLSVDDSDVQSIKKSSNQSIQQNKKRKLNNEMSESEDEFVPSNSITQSSPQPLYQRLEQQSHIVILWMNKMLEQSFLAECDGCQSINQPLSLSATFTCMLYQVLAQSINQISSLRKPLKVFDSIEHTARQVFEQVQHDQSINQSTNQSLDPSMYQSITIHNQAKLWICHLLCCLTINQSNHATHQTHNPATNQGNLTSRIQSLTPSETQSINHLIEQIRYAILLPHFIEQLSLHLSINQSSHDQTIDRSLSPLLMADAILMNKALQNEQSINLAIATYQSHGEVVEQSTIDHLLDPTYQSDDQSIKQTIKERELCIYCFAPLKLDGLTTQSCPNGHVVDRSASQLSINQSISQSICPICKCVDDQTISLCIFCRVQTTPRV